MMMDVSSLNTKIKSLLEATFMHIKVEGEIASITYHHASGHLYFSIKDDKSSIKCVMFRSNAQKLKFRLEKGEHIVVEGSVGVYTPRGEYQFYAVQIEPFGKGALALAYEQLKSRLKERGYFEESRKKPIPKSIQTIALVTAKESAAAHDMIKVIQKRYPLIGVTIIDTLVQGERAAGEIATALRYADSLGVDVVIVGRGGGSVEDLWSFNEEVVADAIYSMQTPVVSAVGHEVDVMISDFVADLRAPTPSAAIEMILPDTQELLYMLDEYTQRYNRRIEQILYHKQEQLRHQNDSLHQHSITRRLQRLGAEFATLHEEYSRVMHYRLQNYSSLPTQLYANMQQQMRFVQRRQRDKLQLLQQKYKSNNPKDGIKDGWGKLSIDGKRINISQIEEGIEFVVEDCHGKVSALCQDKNIFSV